MARCRNRRPEAIDAAFDRLADRRVSAIVRDPSPDIVSRVLQFPPPMRRRHSMREARRALRRDWWVHSFSQLAREESGTEPDAIDAQGAEDEPPEIALEPIASPYVGARFGNALHAALETIDFARWRDWQDTAPPPGEEDALRRALGANGYVDDGIAGGLALLATLVRDTVNTRLPEGARLADIAPADRRAEIEFHFALSPVSVERLIALLHRHEVLRDRDGFGTRERLEGLMTGRIDLVYLHADRIYLVDYKSNRLADYSSVDLRARCATANTTCSTSSTRLRCIAGSDSGAPTTTTTRISAACAISSAAASIRRATTVPACSSRGRRAR